MTENNSFGDTFQEKIQECEAVIRHAVKGKFPHEQALDELVGYAKSQQRKPLWIDPNDKTQAKFLPNIGEPVLFCHGGKTYYGRHTGGSFQYGAGVTRRNFYTWECHWMPIPAAHGIKE